MRIKSFTMIESILILLVASLLTSIYFYRFPKIINKEEVISSIIHTQFKSLLIHDKVEFQHDLIDETISFNMNGSINKANTIKMKNSNLSFTIMLFTGRIHE